MIIRGLHLTNYSQGVIFTGLRGSHGHKHDMNGPDFALRHNTVKDCWFERMGNVFNTSLCPCCGAVALVHTHDSTFTMWDLRKCRPVRYGVLTVISSGAQCWNGPR